MIRTKDGGSVNGSGRHRSAQSINFGSDSRGLPRLHVLSWLGDRIPAPLHAPQAPLKERRVAVMDKSWQGRRAACRWGETPQSPQSAAGRTRPVPRHGYSGFVRYAGRLCSIPLSRALESVSTHAGEWRVVWRGRRGWIVWVDMGGGRHTSGDPTVATGLLCSF